MEKKGAIPMMMGIMGGTLDPVHNGHLEIAQAVQAACGLDGVMLLPAGDPPHKKRERDRWDRLEMARLAAQDCPGMVVSDVEVSREGTTYTVDTLRQLRQEHPDVEWTYIIGADTVCALASWKDFAQVAKLCAFAAVGRPGCAQQRTRDCAASLEKEYGARIQFLDVDGPDISSTEIRARVAENRPIAGYVPEKVERYIREKGLYLCGMTWEELEQTLSARLKVGRFLHTQGVARTAMELAARNGVDPQRARLAGMLHDCAKSMPYGDMVALVRANVPDADEEEIATEPVLHAPAGMVVARRDFGVRDPEILSAIRKHTLGGPDMTPMEALIYVADFIEPNRRPFDGLEQARELAQTDLYGAARLCARLTSAYIIRKGGTPSARTTRMLD